MIYDIKNQSSFKNPINMLLIFQILKLIFSKISSTKNFIIYFLILVLLSLVILHFSII